MLNISLEIFPKKTHYKQKKKDSKYLGNNCSNFSRDVNFRELTVIEFSDFLQPRVRMEDSIFCGKFVIRKTSITLLDKFNSFAK